jgi:hypothetical protein
VCLAIVGGGGDRGPASVLCICSNRCESREGHRSADQCALTRPRSFRRMLLQPLPVPPRHFEMMGGCERFSAGSPGGACGSAGMAGGPTWLGAGATGNAGARCARAAPADPAITEAHIRAPARCCMVCIACHPGSRAWGWTEASNYRPANCATASAAHGGPPVSIGCCKPAAAHDAAACLSGPKRPRIARTGPVPSCGSLSRARLH